MHSLQCRGELSWLRTSITTSDASVRVAWPKSWCNFRCRAVLSGKFRCTCRIACSLASLPATDSWKKAQSHRRSTTRSECICMTVRQTDLERRARTLSNRGAYRSTKELWPWTTNCHLLGFDSCMALSLACLGIVRDLDDTKDQALTAVWQSLTPSRLERPLL